jgi:hypothetical protein
MSLARICTLATRGGEPKRFTAIRTEPTRKRNLMMLNDQERLGRPLRVSSITVRTHDTELSTDE